jgi:hypothetical protein
LVSQLNSCDSTLVYGRASSGGQTTRAVNPIAWDKGMVYCQCGQCQVWHVLAANNKAIYEEIRFKDEEPN